MGSKVGVTVGISVGMEVSVGTSVGIAVDFGMMVAVGASSEDLRLLVSSVWDPVLGYSC